MNLRSVLMLGTFVAGAAASTVAYAQDIEVVTVTAAKREQNVQDVPISMNVVSQKELEKYNLSDMQDISRQIPGMVFVKTNNISTISLRGFGSSSANPAIDQTVAVYTDGVFMGRARQFMLPFFDVERMEVLRGPQGALLGKNTAAGAVNFVTAKPKDEFEASATVSYLIDRQGVDAFGYITGPVTDDLSARLAVKFVDKGGWVHNNFDNTDVPTVNSKQGRLSLHFQPSEGFDMYTVFGYDSMNQKGKAISGFTTLTQRPQVNFQQTAAGGDYDRHNGYHFSNTANISVFDDMTFVSITGFDSYTSDVITSGQHTSPETVLSRFEDDFKQASQEFRLLSPTGGTFEWIVGAYADYSYQRLDNTGMFTGFLGVISFNATTYFKQNAYTYSGYATGTYHVTDDLSLIVGVRGTQTHKKGTLVNGPYRSGVFPGYIPGRILSGSLSEGSFDPSATLQYKLTDDVMVYVGWSKGSKSGSFQGANRTVLTTDYQVRPEVSENVEIGVKSTLWDFLTFNATGYILKFKNLQTGQYVGTPPTLTTRNAADAESKGVELVLGANFNQWIEGLRFDLSGNYIDARYVDYVGATCTFAASQAAAGTCVSGTFTTGANAGQKFNGAGLPFTILPNWSATYGLTYVRPIMEGLKVELNVSADSQSHYWMDAGLFDARYGFQSGNTKLHFRVALADQDDMWSVALIGRNVNDVLTTSGGSIVVGAARAYGIDEGRSLSIQGSVKF